MQIFAPSRLALLLTAMLSSIVSAQPYMPATLPSGDIMPMPAEPKLPTLWLVGDSTVYTFNGKVGWGTPLEQMFDKSRINVVNRARGGRSSRSFQTEGLWDRVLAESKPGDFVLLQMGHNDGNGTTVNAARGSLLGIGDEIQELENAQTKKKEVVHTYGWYMAKYASDAKAKGLIPILCSPIPRAPKEKIQPGSVEESNYVKWAEQVAQRDHIPFIHLNKLIMSHYAGMEPQDVKTKYFFDAQHTTADGAVLNALCVVDGIRQLKDLQLSKFITVKEQIGDWRI